LQTEKIFVQYTKEVLDCVSGTVPDSGNARGVSTHEHEEREILERKRE